MKKLWTVLTMFLLMTVQVLPVCAAQEIPKERLLPRLVDEGDLLTDTEEAALLAQLDEISERQQCDVVVVTAETLGAKGAQAYADDFFDYNGYGYGAGDDGILLMVCMEYRDFAISTYGYGVTAFTDAGISYMEDQFLPDLSAGNYAASFRTFADLCDQYLTQARTAQPYDVRSMPNEKRFAFTPLTIVGMLLGAYIGGWLIALIVALVKKSALKSVAKKTQANVYMDQFNLSRREDRYINSTTTSHTVRKESGSSGGGSSVHTSSSGRSHGGHSGKF